MKTGGKSWGTQSSRRLAVIVLVLGVCVICDRISKYWALEHLRHGEPRPLIPGLIQLTLTSNPGAAFSLGSQNGQVMGGVATFLTICLVVWVVKRTLSTVPLPVVEQIGMGCLLGGAIGNLIDRYTQGRVTDFLEFVFISFPVFNVADVLIDVGLALIAIAILFSSGKPRGNKNVGLV